MNICSEDPEEIVHESRNCPLCIAIEEINDLESQIGEIDKAISELSEKVQELEAQLADIPST